MTEPDHSPGDSQPPNEDGYDGLAEIVDGDRVISVRVTLRGHFDPITGSYSWYGRVAADPEVTALAQAGRHVVLRTPHAEVPTGLTDLDPWGRARVSGFGAAPFLVLDSLAD